MLQMYKVCSCLWALGEWDAVCARDRIQARIQALVQDLQAEAYGTSLDIDNDNDKMRIYKIWYKIYKLYRNIYKLHQSFGYLVGTPREQAGGEVDDEWMGER